MGRVDKHSHDAEWLRGARCWGAGGVGEGLASSPKPAARQEDFIAFSVIIINGRSSSYCVISYLLKATHSVWRTPDGFFWSWSSAS